MSQKHKKSRNRLLWLLVFPVAGFILLLRLLIADKNVALFNPKGLIAQEQHNLMIFSVFVLLTIAFPVLFILFSIAWKYRDTNPEAIHTPIAKHSKSLVLIIWLIPTVFIVILATVMIPATHRLSPKKSIAADIKPMKIQVVALRWKWLFIYPEQKIATVNYMQIPIDTPVTFELTADETPMSSFWIPNLGGQLYAMTGHVNPLNLMATVPGDYPGSTAEINGRGFAGMRFTARASSTENFEQWVQETKQSPYQLDEAAYKELLKPSENNPVAAYSAYEKDLYDKVVMKYMGTTEGHGHHE